MTIEDKKQEDSAPLVLVGAPVAQGKDYILWEWLDYIESLSYPNKEIYLVDNSDDPDYHLKIRERGINCDYYPPANKPHQQILSDCQNLIRDHALCMGADYLFMNECDVFAPQNIIEHFVAQDKDVISATYFLEHGEKTTLCVSHYDDYFAKVVKLIPPYEIFFSMDGSVKEVGSAGIGCTLFKRELLEEIAFKWNTAGSAPGTNWMLDRTVFSDTLFYMDCHKRGVEVLVDTSILCRHERSNWEHDAQFLKRLPKSLNV